MATTRRARARFATAIAAVAAPLLALALTFASGLGEEGEAYAQPKGSAPKAGAPRTGGAARSTAPRRPAKGDAGTPPATVAPEPRGLAGDAGAAPPREPPVGTGTSASDAGVIEAKSGDGGPRVFRFGELEIEGRLRSPQLVYFLRRVRAEFAAEDLGHRTFMRELSETRKDPNF